MSIRSVRIATRLFTPEVGAAAFRERVLADAFAERGLEVEVVTTTPPASLSDQPIDDGGLTVMRWPAARDANGNIRGYLQYLSYDVPLALRLLARRRPDLYVAEPPPTTGLVVRVVATVHRRPYVYYAADVWSDAAGSAGAPRFLVAGLRRLETWVLRGATLVLAVSDGVAERVQLLGVPQDRITVVGNGVDTTVFTPDGASADATEPYFVYTGTMSEWQGAEVFIRALAEHRKRGGTLRLVFLGQGSELPQLKRIAQDLTPGAVDFLGVVPPARAAEWLRGATAALVSIKPGLGYDFAKPTKIYAATACGTPVIFAGQGASTVLVTSAQLGWASDYGAEAVADAMAAAGAATEPGTTSARRERLVAWTAENASLSAAARSAVQAALGAVLTSSDAADQGLDVLDDLR